MTQAPPVFPLETHRLRDVVEEVRRLGESLHHPLEAEATATLQALDHADWETAGATAQDAADWLLPFCRRVARRAKRSPE